jgi:hypothetical protein
MVLKCGEEAGRTVVLSDDETRESADGVDAHDTVGGYVRTDLARRSIFINIQMSTTPSCSFESAANLSWL